MSRIITNNLRHNDATADNLTLDGTGNITAPGNLTTSGNLSVTGTSTLTDDLVVDTDTLFVDASTDRVGIGTTSPDTAVTVSEANVAVTSSSSNVNIYANDALAADIGGSIGLGATWNGSGFINYGSIHGKKANSTSGNTDGYMSFVVRDNGGTQERLRITSDGTLQLRNSAGIDFSQIQTNASGMDSETLDSYEEGSWTPTMSGATLSGESGNYTRIGRFVHAHFYCPVSSHNNDTTVVSISGLPFTGHERSVGASLIVRNGIDHTIQLLATYNGSSFTSIKFAKTVNDGNSSDLKLNDCNTSFHLAGAIQYHVQ